MCGCKGMGQNSGKARANLQSPRKQFVAPNSPVNNQNQIPSVPNTNNFMLQQPVKQGPQPPASAADRRRIQRLNQDAIKRALNH